MKTLSSNVATFTLKHANTLRVVLVVMTLAMFIFTAGAADCGGTVGR
jgi:hypothetical protein